VRHAPQQVVVPGNLSPCLPNGCFDLLYRPGIAQNKTDPLFALFPLSAPPFSCLPYHLGTEEYGFLFLTIFRDTGALSVHYPLATPKLQKV